MALKEIVISDINGKELESSQVAKIRVSGHPALGSRVVVLDAGVDEAEKFESSAQEFVYLEVDLPGGSKKEVVLDVADFNKVFGAKADVAGILTGAREALDKPATNGRGRGRKTNGTASEKIDYTAPDNFGKLHRGRPTEEEKELVRSNIEQASNNRVAQGHGPINWQDPKERERYGMPKL